MCYDTHPIYIRYHTSYIYLYIIYNYIYICKQPPTHPIYIHIQYIRRELLMHVSSLFEASLRLSTQYLLYSRNRIMNHKQKHVQRLNTFDMHHKACGKVIQCTTHGITKYAIHTLILSFLAFFFYIHTYIHFDSAKSQEADFTSS